MLKVFLDHSSVSCLNLGLTHSRWLTGPRISASQSAGMMSGPSYPPHPLVHAGDLESGSQACKTIA